MRVLSIIAQKPNSTGSGVYLTEIVRCFKELGMKQEVICACYKDDEIYDTENVKYNKLIFNEKDIPIKIAGMSDVMPYESMKYSDFINRDNELKIWITAFKTKIIEVINRFRPELIICHHLYLLTAMTVDILKSSFANSDKPKIVGICHNTDLRQFRQTNLMRAFIKDNIKKLDKVFAPSSEHANIAKELFDIGDEKIELVGIGYNSKIFYDMKLRDRDDTKNRVLYVGKVAKKKGVFSLIKAINMLNDENINLYIIGGAGDKDEYDEIVNESKKSKSRITFLGQKKQAEIAEFYNKSEVFVLPSFSEGIPMVPLEALACGCKVVISNLLGLKEFYDKNVKNASISYVELPKLTNVDDASDFELDEFQKRLANAIKKSLEDKNTYKPDLSLLTWESIAKKIIMLNEYL